MSNQPKQTPGQWTYRPYKSGPASFQIASGDNWFLADVYDGNGAYPAEDNARLMAAAPELLEALKGLLEASDPDSVPGDALRLRCEQAEAAIARAESAA